MDLTARNPDGTPAPPRPAPVSARPGLLARLKLTEPARLYGHGVVLLQALSLIPLLLATSWSPLHTWAIAALVAMAAAVEAIRASVYSPASLLGMLIARQAQPSTIDPRKDLAA